MGYDLIYDVRILKDLQKPVLNPFQDFLNNHSYFSPLDCFVGGTSRFASKSDWDAIDKALKSVNPILLRYDQEEIENEEIGCASWLYDSCYCGQKDYPAAGLRLERSKGNIRIGSVCGFITLSELKEGIFGDNEDAKKRREALQNPYFFFDEGEEPSEKIVNNTHEDFEKLKNYLNQDEYNPEEVIIFFTHSGWLI